MARPKIENHKTAALILESAERHFLDKGFEGTSINDVADDAKINKSLIYHHFKDKENLWKAVKEQILERASNNRLEELDFKRPTLKEFLEVFVSFRFRLYGQHPELVRLMEWQRLEPEGRTLSGVKHKSFAELDAFILSLQKNRQIRGDLKPEVILYLIMSMSSSGFMDKAPFLDSQKGQNHYLKLIVDSLTTILRTKP
jgi:AcrR family transcriptional regulator